MKEEHITAALELLDEASPGPARWTNPCTGKRADGRLNDPVVEFARMLGHQRAAAAVRAAIPLADQVDEMIEVHGVSIPNPARGSFSVADVEAGGEHLLVAITGNGPKSRANARAIAGMLSTEIGWKASLLEVRRLRSYADRIVDERDAEAIKARWLREQLEHKTEEAAVAGLELADAEEKIERLTKERDQAIARQDRSLCLAELEGASLALDEIAAALKRERSTGRYEILGDGENSRQSSDAEIIKAVLEERDEFAAKLAEKSRAHEDLREEVFSAIEGGFGIMTAQPGETIRKEGVRLGARVLELRGELVRIHGVLRDMLVHLGRESEEPRLLASLRTAIRTEISNLERETLGLTDWRDGIVNDAGPTIIKEDDHHG